MTILSVADHQAPIPHAQASAAGPCAGSFRPPTASDAHPPWSAATGAGLLAFALLWASQLWFTWAAWGNLSIDSGHEMYVPWMLAQGKMLYRDIWFMYTPAAPYFNSYLFRLLGVHLNVLYWAGSLAALGSAVFLYLAGIKVSSPLAGWTAGAVVLLEAFQPSLFCFPLPYSFSIVYGCLVGCAFLWLAVNAYAGGWLWMTSAGLAGALALLLKPEFGIACYATLALLILAQCYSCKSWKPLAAGAAACIPGGILCAAVAGWMVSIAGAEFITQENIMSWPSAYFMRAYGKLWLEHTGFTTSAAAFYDAFLRAIPLAAIALLAYSLLWWKEKAPAARAMRILLALAIPVLLVATHLRSSEDAPRHTNELLSAVFFPQDMALYVCLGAVFAWGHFVRNASVPRAALRAIIFTYTALLSFRILMGMASVGYPIYYNGPVVLCFLLMAFLLFSESKVSRAAALLGKGIVSLGCLTTVFLMAYANEAYARAHYVPMVTARGTVRVTPTKKENYEAAIRFMREKANLGESVLSVPEDTSLYFLSSTECPTRVYGFTPGALAPGKMVRETIQQIEAKPVRYLLWSNRIFTEYDAPVFGVHFDVPLGDYLKAHYHPVGRLVPVSSSMWEWTAVVWERSPAPGGAKHAPEEKFQ